MSIQLYCLQKYWSNWLSVSRNLWWTYTETAKRLYRQQSVWDDCWGECLSESQRNLQRGWTCLRTEFSLSLCLLWLNISHDYVSHKLMIEATDDWNQAQNQNQNPNELYCQVCLHIQGICFRDRLRSLLPDGSRLKKLCVGWVGSPAMLRALRVRRVL